MGKKQRERATQEWNDYQLALDLQKEKSASSSGKALVSKHPQLETVLIEFACSDDSKLSAVATAEFKWKSERLAKSRWDLSTNEGIQKVREMIERIPNDAIIHLHGSCPCTAWSAWQHYNLKKHPHLKEKIESERKISIQMVQDFCELAVLIMKKNIKSTVSFEWPKDASGWKVPEILEALSKAN